MTRFDNKGQLDYGKLITGTLRLVWRHKFLWLFGLFAGTSTTIGGWSCNITSDFGVSPEPDEEPGFGNATQSVSDWLNTHMKLVAIIVIAAIAVGFLLWLWSIFCQGAVIGTVRDINNGKGAGFGVAVRHGRLNFPRLLAFNLLLAAIIIGAFIIMAALIVLFAFVAPALTPVLSTLSRLWPLLIVFGIVLVVGMAAIAFIFSFLFLYGSRSVVFEANRPVAALKRGWQVFEGNLARTLLLFLISVALGIASNIIIISITIIAAIPVAAAWILTYVSGFNLAAIIIASAISTLVPAALLVTLAATNTYFASYWTTAYMELTGSVQPHQDPPAAPLPNIG